MKCPNCGKENTNDDIFCIYCGATLIQSLKPNDTDHVSVSDNSPVKNLVRSIERQGGSSVRNILEEYLPQISSPEAKNSSYVIAPDVGVENSRQKIAELMEGSFLIPTWRKQFNKEIDSILDSIVKNGETIQGVYHSGHSKLSFPMGALMIFTDRALYIQGPNPNMSSWYRKTGKRLEVNPKCWYSTVDQVSAVPLPISEGIAPGCNKVTCTLEDSSEQFEFLFEKKYYDKEKLVEMIQLLANNNR